MSQPDLILMHAPSVYDFRQKTILYGPVSEQIPSSPVFEMYPIGFTSIAEYLGRSGYQVRIVNLAVRMLNDASFDAEKMIKKLKSPLFGIDLHWMLHCHGSIEVARLVKKHHPESKVIFGGLSSSYFYRELMQYPEIDYVMRGDSTEEPLRQLMDCIKNRSEPENVPNLVWRDSQGEVRENPFSNVPADLNNLMVGHYGNVLRSVIKYRDLASYVPFHGWADYPITAAFTCRGCTENCVICGGSAAAFRNSYHRGKSAYRTPEAVTRDVREIARFSNGPVFILGDIRQAGEDYAAELLQLLKDNRVKNQIILEIFNPASRDFLQRMGQACPGFCLEISPESHDYEIRKASGRNYTTEDMEQTFSDALDAGCTRLDVFFMIGVPRQTPQSVMDTVDYCGYLMEKHRGDKRLSLFVAPLSPFLDPGSLGFEQPERHVYHVRFQTLEEHRQALLTPGWKYVLNYETEWMTRQQIVDTTYDALIRLTHLKAKYGVISDELAKAETERMEAAQAMMARIEDIISRGKHEELAPLKPEIDRINMSTVGHWDELKLPVGFIKLRFLRSLWYWLTKR